MDVVCQFVALPWIWLQQGCSNRVCSFLSLTIQKVEHTTLGHSKLVIRQGHLAERTGGAAHYVATVLPSETDRQVQVWGHLPCTGWDGRVGECFSVLKELPEFRHRHKSSQQWEIQAGTPPVKGPFHLPSQTLTTPFKAARDRARLWARGT